tara:strand:- start:15952 stop:16626 length:675 start_codon:yes stop_codon:yes gene_type:complete
MFKMANGGMMPPEAMAAPAPMPMDQGMSPGMGQGMGQGMDPEMEMAAMAEMLPAEVLQAASRDMSQATQEVAAEEIGAAADQAAAESMMELNSAGDFREIMNAVWNDQADVSEYRGRLAAVVGQSDADQTPDSVLALVQPTLQLAELDKGIGALMQEELAEVGEVDGGITNLAAKGAIADNLSSGTEAVVNAVNKMSPGGGDEMQMMADMAEMPGPMPMGQGPV